MTILEREDEIDPEMTLEQVAESIRKGVFKPEDFAPEQLRPPVREQE